MPLPGTQFRGDGRVEVLDRIGVRRDVFV